MDAFRGRPRGLLTAGKSELSRSTDEMRRRTVGVAERALLRDLVFGIPRTGFGGGGGTFIATCLAVGGDTRAVALALAFDFGFVGVVGFGVGFFART